MVNLDNRRYFHQLIIILINLSWKTYVKLEEKVNKVTIGVLSEYLCKKNNKNWSTLGQNGCFSFLTNVDIFATAFTNFKILKMEYFCLVSSCSAKNKKVVSIRLFEFYYVSFSYNGVYNLGFIYNQNAHSF